LHYAGTFGTEFDGATFSGVDAFALWLDDPELAVVDLAPRPETGTMTTLGRASIAGVAGALARHAGQAGAR
jgi:hypothetical protein